MRTEAQASEGTGRPPGSEGQRSQAVPPLSHLLPRAVPTRHRTSPKFQVTEQGVRSGGLELGPVPRNRPSRGQGGKEGRECLEALGAGMPQALSPCKSR